MELTLEQFEAAIARGASEGVKLALAQDKQEDTGAFVTDTGEVKSFVDYLLAVRDRDPVALKAMKVLEQATGASGGFTVPIGFRNRILSVTAEAAIVRPRADVVEIGEMGEFSAPTLDQTITPAGVQTAFYGGVQLWWTEEGAPKTEPDGPKFKLFTLKPHEMAGISFVTDRLLRNNAVGMDAYLIKLFGGAIAFYEDYWFLNGDQVGKPQGVIHAPCTIQPNRAVNGQICYADVMSMVHAFYGDGVWVINICCKQQIMQLQDANSNYMWQPNATTEMAKTLLGYPIIWTEKVPPLGTKGDIGLYDFRFYGIGDGSPVTVESSRDFRFDQNQTAFRFFREVDGGPWLSAPITLMDGVTQVSPFVTLDVH